MSIGEGSRCVVCQADPSMHNVDPVTGLCVSRVMCARRHRERMGALGRQIDAESARHRARMEELMGGAR